MRISRFNAFPAGRITSTHAIHKAAAEAARGRKDAADREFTRLCGAIIVLAEDGRVVTVDDLTTGYGFRPAFLQTHARRAADRVARTRPDLAESLGHMTGAQ